MLPFAAPARRVPDTGQTTRLYTTHLPAMLPPPGDPLAPAADPAYPTALDPLPSYLVRLIQPATGGSDPWPMVDLPGWAWTRFEEFPIRAGYIRVAAFKAVVEHSLLGYMPPAGWLAVRWTGYTQPTFFVNRAWVQACLLRVEQYVATLSEEVP